MREGDTGAPWSGETCSEGHLEAFTGRTQTGRMEAQSVIEEKRDARLCGLHGVLRKSTAQLLPTAALATTEAQSVGIRAPLWHHPMGLLIPHSI